MQYTLQVYPDPVKWRKTLKTLLDNCLKDQEIWNMEEAMEKKPKHPLSIPGMKVEGKNAAALKLYKKQFYSCTSCRWSNTGFGCCYCNPSRHEALLEKKKRLAKQFLQFFEQV